ncbi:hypothetical protein GGP41_010034 [Bipolaris sorokiniana]|uniref:Uncharacterized protein n=1 Tax=Cochliobolus sativus TaxID=45130 RepID=A0A8H5ZJL5_COCSA|nr:hypothetical protein GGP41_010034 [Bipolaris sorokiniana]
MAHRTHIRPSMKGLSDGHQQDRSPLHNAAAGIHRTHQRSTSPDTVSGSTHHSEGRGGDQSATEGAADDEDDEDDDSNAVKDDELDDETDTDDVPARPFGYSRGGKGKGKQPAIRIDPVDDDESHAEDDETASHTTGLRLVPSKHPVNQLLMSNKKRTFSNLSSTSVLFGDDSTDQESFPRRKIARKLSNAASVPLLTYTDNEDTQTNDNAIETDDEDYSGVNLVPDDDESDMELMEKQEESYILQEEQQATTLLNEYRDARRLSLDSCLSDNIFDVTAPLDDAFMAGLPDFGFTPFFEPEAVPASPVPMAKRKFSDGSAKRVRFDDDVPMSDSSSSESSELDSSIFPDLFMDQDKIPPSLHQLLEMDNDDDNGDMASPQSDVSFWDFEQNESRITQLDNSDESEGESSESSGYESDMGDTTDEEDFENDILPRTPTQKHSVLHRPSSAPGSRASTPKPFQRSARPIGRQIPPTRGIFIHDETDQAIAVTNRATKAAFYPFVSISSNGNMGIVDEDEDGSSSDDYEDDINITDFMDFGSDGDDTDLDEDDVDDTDVPATPATSQVVNHGSTPAAPSTTTPQTRKRSTSDVMLEHFDRGVVTAFRTNQNRYRDVASLPSDPAARASVSRPVRSGKSAEALITPLRKRSRSNRVAKSPLKNHTNMNQSSPLSGVTKATGRLQSSVMGSPRGPPRMGRFS